MRRPAAIAIVLALVCFALYACFAARDVMFGDGPELTAAAILNGVAHPPGYPIWIMLGHIASWLPVGTLPFRINLTACAYHAVAVALVYLCGYRLVRRSVPAILAALLLGLCSPLFVVWSLQAEVFSLNDLFAAAIVLVCIDWLAQPQHVLTHVCALAVLFGLGLANQQTLLLLTPLALRVLWCNRAGIGWRGRSVVTIATALLVALACFALPFVHTLTASQTLTGWHIGEARTLPALIDVIDRKVYGGAFSLVAFASMRGGSVFDRFAAIFGADGWPIAFPFVGAMLLAVRRHWSQLGVALLLIACPLLLFCALANLDVGDPATRGVFSRFGLLSLTALAPFAALTFDEIVSVIKRNALQTSANVAMLSIVLIVGTINLTRLSLVDSHGPRVLFHDAFGIVAPHAILLTAGDVVDQSYGYFQDIEGMRPDVTIVTYGLLNSTDYVRALNARISAPVQVLYDIAPAARRDILAAANPSRPFYAIGERGIHAPGPRYHALVTGIVSRLIPNNARYNLREHYRDESRLQSAPEYANVSADWWTSNGFGTTAREYYAGGFFSTGYDAEQLNDPRAALGWYERTEAYFPDPLAEQRIAALRNGVLKSNP